MCTVVRDDVLQEAIEADNLIHPEPGDFLGGGRPVHGMKFAIFGRWTITVRMVVNLLEWGGSTTKSRAETVQEPDGLLRGCRFIV